MNAVCIGDPSRVGAWRLDDEDCCAPSEPMFQFRRAFTLVELLVVIGIIAILIGILLPVISSAISSASTVKCAFNLRSVGQGIANYVTTYKGSLPASNFWRGLAISGNTQLPSTPVYGTVHWSSYLYGQQDRQNNGEIYRSAQGWEMFQCPSLPDGGLPPANTFPGNSTLPNETSIIDPSTGKPVIDAQAPRMAYTLNEALCPRGFFVTGAFVVGNQIQRPYHFIRAGSVAHASQTILGTELWGIQSIMEIDSLVTPGAGIFASASRRPVSGFTNGLTGPEMLWQLPNPAGQYASLFPINRVGVTDLSPDPSATMGPGATPSTTLDWVGRNHGRKALDSSGFDKRKTNFLYLDGHVETKSIVERVAPRFEWGDKFYTLAGGDNIQ